MHASARLVPGTLTQPQLSLQVQGAVQRVPRSWPTFRDMLAACAGMAMHACCFQPFKAPCCSWEVMHTPSHMPITIHDRAEVAAALPSPLRHAPGGCLIASKRSYSSLHLAARSVASREGGWGASGRAGAHYADHRIARSKAFRPGKGVHAHMPGAPQPQGEAGGDIRMGVASQ